MSLDIYLEGNRRTVPCICSHCDHRHERQEVEELYNANITHNLGAMAREAGIYECLWRASENGITKAHQLTNPLCEALQWMRQRPEYFRQFDAENGWGTYDNFVPWLGRLLEACQRHPDAYVRIWR